MTSQHGSMSNEDLSLLEKYGDLSLDDEGLGNTWGEGLEIGNTMNTMDLYPLATHLEEMDALAPGAYLPAMPDATLPTGLQSAAAVAKLEWQRAIIEDELSRPLEVPEDFIQELAAREAEVEASVMRDLRMHVAAVASLKEKLYEKSEASQQTLLSSAQRLDNIASLAAAGLVPQESVNTVANRAANALAVREVGLHESMLRLQQLEARISQLEGRTSGAALASALGVPLAGGGGVVAPAMGGARSPLASSKQQQQQQQQQYHAKEGGGGVASGRMGIAPALGLVYTRKKGNPPPGAKRMYAVERAEEALARLAAASSLSTAAAASISFNSGSAAAAAPSAFSLRGAPSAPHLLPSNHMRPTPSLQQLPDSQQQQQQQQYYNPSSHRDSSHSSQSASFSSSSSSSSSSSFAPTAAAGGSASGAGGNSTFLTSLDYDPTVAVASGMGGGVLNELVSRYLSNPTPPSSLLQQQGDTLGFPGRGRVTGGGPGAGVGARFTASMGPAVGRTANNRSSSGSSSSNAKLSSKQQAEIEAKRKAVAAAKAVRDQRGGGGGGGPKKSPTKPTRSTFGNPPPIPPPLPHASIGGGKTGGGGGVRSSTIGPTSGVARALAAERERAAGRRALVGGAARPAVRPTAAAAASGGSGGVGWGRGPMPRKTAASSSSSSSSSSSLGPAQPTPRLEGGGVRGGARVAAHRATLSLFQNFKSSGAKSSSGVSNGTRVVATGYTSAAAAAAAAAAAPSTSSSSSLGPASKGYGAAATLASMASSLSKPTAGHSSSVLSSAFRGAAAASSTGGAHSLPGRSVSRPGVRGPQKPALDLFVGRASAAGLSAASKPLVVSGGQVMRGRR